MTGKYIELHLHFDGAARLTTLYELSKKKNLVKTNSIDEFAKFVSIGKKNCFNSLTDFLSTFKHILSLIAGDKKCLEQIAYEICEDQFNQGILYTEIRYNPHILTGNNLSLDEVIESINAGINRGCSTYPIFVNCILCCLRSKPLWSLDIVNLAIKHKNNRIVGIDIAGDEKNYSDYLHRTAFKFAHKNNINITAHAGEAGDSQNIKSAIKNLYAKRIGHGYACANDNFLIAFLKKKNIHLECCPTSSIQTKSVENFNEHPIKIFHQNNLNFSINTDDSSIFNITFTNETNLVKKLLNLNENQIQQIMINSLESSFASKKEKIKIKELLSNNWTK